MKEIKVTMEQIIYEITKKELDTIKREERNKGRYDIIEYIRFAIKNYIYHLNLNGIKYLINNLVDFLLDRTDTIQNTCEYSFFDYIKKYR